jgi:glycosyltransferase involved in cell wall biosynthesis
MWSYTFTVFTPTYNRIQTLPAVFESLLAQTYKDFEWLIVDDGSTDGTGALVDSWRNQSWFPIRYLYQTNGGKHVAFNRGVGEAHGELFLTLDSDDTCMSTALARFKHHWDSIPEAQRGSFSAVTVLCVDELGRVVGDSFPVGGLDSNSLELRYRYKIKGEYWGFQRTEVLRQFPFPSAPGMSFVPEGVVWNSIARHYRTRYVNEKLRVYRIRDQGQVSHLSRMPPTPAHAAGRAVYYAGVLNQELDWFWHSPQYFVWSALQYVRFRRCAGSGSWKELGPVQTLAGSVLTLCVWPAGWLLSFLDRRRIAAASAREVTIAPPS